MGKLFNRAGMTVTGAPGTGTITLNAAIASPKKYLSFAAAGVANGDVVSYLIEDGTEFEHGSGTYTASGVTLSRDVVRKSSDGGLKISATSAALVYVDAGAEDIPPVPDVQTFNADGTWTKPQGNYRMALIECWGGGGSGGVRTTTGNAGGGGGGSRVERTLLFSVLGSTEVVNVGAGGASVASSNNNGNDGADTGFGAWVTAYGGNGGLNAANNVSARGGAGAGPGGRGIGTDGGAGGGGDSINASSIGIHGHARGDGGGGAGGGVSSSNTLIVAGKAAQGGGGGGATTSTGPSDQAGGTSQFGGAGGNGSGTAATAGAQPGGGGGAARNGQASGAGGSGRVIVTCW